MPTEIVLNDITKTYHTDKLPVRAVNGISLTLEKGSFTAIVGKSGSGKSTLLKIMGTLEQPTSGTVELSGCNIAALKPKELARFRRQKIGFVFQQFQLLPEYSVWENICMPVFLDHKEVDTGYITSLCKTLQIEDKLPYSPDELSGGEQQRAAIARALSNRPAILLADEPTGNLDYQTGLETMQALEAGRALCGQTVVMVTHDQEWASRADSIIQIKDGRVMETNP